MLLSVKDISYIYSEGLPYEKSALDGVSFDVEKGKVYGIIGHTGSGKSTLLQIIIGLLMPSSGDVLFHGRSIFEKGVSLREIRSKIGLVFQYPEYQLFEETVRADIGFAPKNMGLAPDEIENRVLGAMRLAGLSEDILDKSPFELSGGQKRRVAIAGVIAMEPEILVLDEPAAGLDPAARDEILGNIRELKELYDMTIILVSHSMEDIAKLADEILVFNQGKIAMQGTPREVYRNYEELEKIGLSSPQVTRLVHRLTGEYVCTVEEAKQAILARVGGGNRA